MQEEIYWIATPYIHFVVYSYGLYRVQLKIIIQCLPTLNTSPHKPYPYQLELTFVSQVLLLCIYHCAL